MICDAHVHFFSPGFFDTLGAQKGLPLDGRVGVEGAHLTVARHLWITTSLAQAASTSRAPER